MESLHWPYSTSRARRWPCSALATYALATSNLFDSRRHPFSDNSHWPLLALFIAACTCGAAMLVVSGIGYLKRRRLLGRAVGNAFVVVAIATAIGFALFMDARYYSVAAGLVALYPLATAVLINGPFKVELAR